MHAYQFFTIGREADGDQYILLERTHNSLAWSRGKRFLIFKNMFFAGPITSKAKPNQDASFLRKCTCSTGIHRGPPPPPHIPIVWDPFCC